MSRLDSLHRAIRLIEEIERAFKPGHGGICESKIVEDLQAIAKDVRYGGHWEGDYVAVADSLDACAERECEGCKYRDLLQHGTCTTWLKADAARVIRQMEAERKTRLRVV